MEEMYAYHVVTDRPVHLRQHIVFDEIHHNGVFQRVNDKLDIVNDIYAHPSKYNEDMLEHHTSVALRELALEEVRLKKFPTYPSRMACLYVSNTLEEAERWCKLFINWGRPTYQIVKLKIRGNCFSGDAHNCFSARLDHKQNLLLAEHYWKNLSNANCDDPIIEILVNGDIEIVEIVKEINTNI